MKWPQSAVKRKAFQHGEKSMVRESPIWVVEICRNSKMLVVKTHKISGTVTDDVTRCFLPWISTRGLLWVLNMVKWSWPSFSHPSVMAGEHGLAGLARKNQLGGDHLFFFGVKRINSPFLIHFQSLVNQCESYIL